MTPRAATVTAWAQWSPAGDGRAHTAQRDCLVWAQGQGAVTP
jgi:hypothetical protein